MRGGPLPVDAACMTKTLAALSLISLVLVGSQLAPTASAGPVSKLPEPTRKGGHPVRPYTPITGSIVRTDKTWICNGPVDLDSVRVTMTPAIVGDPPQRGRHPPASRAAPAGSAASRSRSPPPTAIKVAAGRPRPDHRRRLDPLPREGARACTRTACRCMGGDPDHLPQPARRLRPPRRPADQLEPLHQRRPAGRRPAHRRRLRPAAPSAATPRTRSASSDSVRSGVTDSTRLPREVPEADARDRPGRRLARRPRQHRRRLLALQVVTLVTWQASAQSI